MLFLDVGVVGCMEVEGQIASAAQLACPLRIGRVYLVKVSLEVWLPANPLANTILGAEGALQFRARPIS
jgi:hypothetical protein